MTPLLSTAFLRTQTDERLAALVAEGHERAFEAIVERYRRPLLRYCRRMLPQAQAEDVVQQSFVNAWASVRSGTRVREVRPWLYRIAHNGAVNALARSGYDYDELHESLRGASPPGEDVERREVIRQTLTGLAALPERQRNALLAVAVEGRSHEDVARELGLTDGALRQLVFRARRSLRAAATALTPTPVANWLLAGADHQLGPTRIAELVSGAGGVGAAAKLGAVVLATGAVVGGSTQGLHLRDRSAAAGPAAARAVAGLAPRPSQVPALTQPRRGPRLHDRPRAGTAGHRRRSAERRRDGDDGRDGSSNTGPSLSGDGRGTSGRDVSGSDGGKGTSGDRSTGDGGSVAGGSGGSDGGGSVENGSSGSDGGDSGGSLITDGGGSGGDSALRPDTATPTTTTDGGPGPSGTGG